MVILKNLPVAKPCRGPTRCAAAFGWPKGFWPTPGMGKLSEVEAAEPIGVRIHQGVYNKLTIFSIFLNFTQKESCISTIPRWWLAISRVGEPCHVLLPPRCLCAANLISKPPAAEVRPILEMVSGNPNCMDGVPKRTEK